MHAAVVLAGATALLPLAMVALVAGIVSPLGSLGRNRTVDTATSAEEAVATTATACGKRISTSRASRTKGSRRSSLAPARLVRTP